MKRILIVVLVILLNVGCSSTNNDSILEENTFIKTDQDGIYMLKSWNDNEVIVEHSEDGKLIYEELKIKGETVESSSYEYEMEGDMLVGLTQILDMYLNKGNDLHKIIYTYEYIYEGDLLIKEIKYTDSSGGSSNLSTVEETEFSYNSENKIRQSQTRRTLKSGELSGEIMKVYNYIENDGYNYVVENVRSVSYSGESQADTVLLYKEFASLNTPFTAYGKASLLNNRNNVFTINEWKLDNTGNKLNKRLNDILYYKTSINFSRDFKGVASQERYAEFIQILDENGQSIGYKKKESDFYFEPLTASNNEIKYDEVYYYNDDDNNSYFKLDIDGGKANQYVKNLLDTDKYEDKDIAVITNIKVNEDKSITKKEYIIDRNSELYNKLLSYKVDNSKTESFISSLNLSIGFPWDSFWVDDDEEVNESVIAPPMDPRAHEIGKAKILGFLADNLYLIEDDDSLLDNLKYEGPGDQVTKDLYAIYSDNNHPLIWLEIDLNSMTIYDFMTGEPLN